MKLNKCTKPISSGVLAFKFRLHHKWNRLGGLCLLPGDMCLIYDYRTWFDILSVISIHSLECPSSENSNVLKPALHFSLFPFSLPFPSSLSPALSHFLRGPRKREMWLSKSRCHGCSTTNQGTECTLEPRLLCVLAEAAVICAAPQTSSRHYPLHSTGFTYRIFWKKPHFREGCWAFKSALLTIIKVITAYK